MTIITRDVRAALGITICLIVLALPTPPASASALGQQAVFLVCGETGVGNIDAREDGPTRWTSRAPGDGDVPCVHHTRPTSTNAVPAESLRMQGTFAGLLDAVTIGMWATQCCVARLTDPLFGIGLSTYYTVVIDGDVVIRDREIVLSPARSLGGVEYYEVTITDLGLLDPETDTGIHDIEVHLEAFNYGDQESTTYSWGNASVASGLVFNPSRPAAATISTKSR